MGSSKKKEAADDEAKEEQDILAQFGAASKQADKVDTSTAAIVEALFALGRVGLLLGRRVEIAAVLATSSADELEGRHFEGGDDE